MEPTDKYAGRDSWFFPPLDSKYRRYDGIRERRRIENTYGRAASEEYWRQYNELIREYKKSFGILTSDFLRMFPQEDRETVREYDTLRDKQPMFTSMSSSAQITGVTTTGARVNGTIHISNGPQRWDMESTSNTSLTESEHSMNLSATAVRVITGYVGQVVDLNTDKVIWQSSPVTEADLTETQQEQLTERPDRAANLLNNLAVKKAKDKIAEVTASLFADGPEKDPEAS